MTPVSLYRPPRALTSQLTIWGQRAMALQMEVTVTLRKLRWLRVSPLHRNLYFLFCRAKVTSLSLSLPPFSETTSLSLVLALFLPHRPCNGLAVSKLPAHPFAFLLKPITSANSTILFALFSLTLCCRWLPSVLQSDLRRLWAV